MSTNRIVGVAVALVCVILATALHGQAPGKPVAYPERYREWTHVKSMVIERGHPLFDSFGGIHHIYANGQAAGALRDRKPFPDGSVLVFDLLTAVEENNAIAEGPRKVLGVMQRNAAAFSTTGGWGFEGFKGDTRDRVVKDAVKECFACHQTQAAGDFVFSEWRR